jgi:ribose/xylose/arabinose/galactoside ABC-type transport system permease subunit
VIVVRLRLPSFIVTLGGSFIVEGILLYVLDHVFEGGGAPVQSNVLSNLTTATSRRRSPGSSS